MKKNARSNAVALLIALAIGYLAFIINSQFVANQMLFKPPLIRYRDNSHIIKLTTADGKKISAIYLPNSQSDFVILYSHGNGVDLARIYPLLNEFHSHGYSIFAYDYHGYGTSEGKPSEKNTYLDIDAAYAFLTKTLAIPANKIVAMGTSLGAGVTIDLATRKPLAAIILQSPFVSAFRVVTIVPLLPFDKYENLKKINAVRVPVLIIHGENDLTIPFWHGRELFNAIKSDKKELWVREADHNNILQKAGDLYWQTIHQFVSNLDETERNPRNP